MESRQRKPVFRQSGSVLHYFFRRDKTFIGGSISKQNFLNRNINSKKNTIALRQLHLDKMSVNNLHFNQNYTQLVKELVKNHN